MPAITSVTQGGDVPFQFDLGGLPVTDFTCTIIVKQRPEGSSFITPRLISPVDNEWTGFLTTVEVGALPKGRFELIGLIANATTLEGQEIPRRFQILTTWNS